MLRPCIGCGEPSTGTRCAECRPAPSITPRRPSTRTTGNAATDKRWRALSQRARRAQPWCLDCGATDDLTGDHIIPVAQRPDLAHEVLNIAVRCRKCNSAKGDTRNERDAEAVLAAIAARRRRRPGGNPRSGTRSVPGVKARRGMNPTVVVQHGNSSA